MGRKLITQGDRVIDYLKNHDFITGNEARFYLSIADLPKCVSLLRESGHIVYDEWVSSKNQFGEKCRFKKYWIDKEQPCQKLNG